MESDADRIEFGQPGPHSGDDAADLVVVDLVYTSTLAQVPDQPSEITVGFHGGRPGLPLPGRLPIS
jgi:hypothetical protein